jgi:hypothetical protein
MLESGVQNLGIHDYISVSFYTLKGPPMSSFVHMLNSPGCGDGQAGPSFSDAVVLENKARCQLFLNDTLDV